MTKNELENIMHFCAEIAQKAGAEIMKVYNDAALFKSIEYKADTSPLTLADKAANGVIVAALKKEYPTFAVLSEEEKDDLSRLNNPLCFVVDPLDGTKEFIKRNGQFTVNIALAENGRAVMGVIYVPATQQLFYAAKGCGSFFEDFGAIAGTNVAKSKNLNEETAEKSGRSNAVKITTSSETDLKKVRFVMSNSHASEETHELIEKNGIVNFVKMGSSLKGCVVAKGEAEIYYRHGYTMEWDTAAMQCIAEEAGAVFLQMDGSEMTYNRENSLNEKGFFIVNRRENILHNLEVNL